MTKIGTAWSKLRWSLAQRGASGTIRSAFGRLRRRDPELDERSRAVHPFDLRHEVDTGGLIGGGELRSGHSHDVFNTAYYGMAPSRFYWAVDFWLGASVASAPAEYSFVDLGCGKGRAVMMASEYAFRQAIGVELHPGLARTARENVAKWQAAGKNRCPMEIVRMDATEFVFPPGPCLIYLFNPFAAPVMKRLVERLETEFAGRAGLLDLIYFNPESEHLLGAHPGFTRLWSGTVAMSEEDRAADSVASPEDLCSIYRWTGTTA